MNDLALFSGLGDDFCECFLLEEYFDIESFEDNFDHELDGIEELLFIRYIDS
jgi:hypothetical protein